MPHGLVIVNGARIRHDKESADNRILKLANLLKRKSFWENVKQVYNVVF